MLTISLTGFTHTLEFDITHRNKKAIQKLLNIETFARLDLKVLAEGEMA